MKRFGLIGYPLSHSFSKQYFTEKFKQLGLSDHRYDLFELKDIAELPKLIESEPGLCGLNVTIPHKIQVLPYLDSIDNKALQTGAVNCIRIKREAGKTILHGYNTDVYGFMVSLEPLLRAHHKKALILGSGGASRAVQTALSELSISFSLVSRYGPLTYETLTGQDIHQHQLIINTTPLGMYPDIHSCPPIPYHTIGTGHLVYDLVYNPADTLFLQKAAAQGAVTKNGLDMLHLQAERSWEIFSA